METKAFNSGNSLAVRIPKAFDFIAAGDSVDIRQVGDTLVLRPIRTETLSDVPALFAQFPKSFMSEGRAEQSQRPRAPIAIKAASPKSLRK
jgi:antitoxin VapB